MSLVAVLTLAVCVGANAAIFSVLYELMIKPLPFADASRIVCIYNSFPKSGLNEMPSNVVQYMDYKHSSHAYSALGLCGINPAKVQRGGTVDELYCADCTPDIFGVFQLKPEIGRLINVRDCEAGGLPVVVLSHSYWLSVFQGESSVLGKRLRVDGVEREIIGVAPATFETLDARIRLIRPLTWSDSDLLPQLRFALTTPLYGRLASGYALGQATAEADLIERRYAAGAVPQIRDFLAASGHQVKLSLLQAERVQSVRDSLLLVQTAALFVLMVGCVNIANLQIVRVRARRTEMAIRMVIGASKAAIFKQFFFEAGVLVFVGLIAGVLLAAAGMGWVNRFRAIFTPSLPGFSLSWGAIALTFCVCAAVALLVSAVTVVSSTSDAPALLLAQAGRSNTPTTQSRRLANGLVSVQCAGAMVMLVTASLLFHSFTHLANADPGFSAANLNAGRIAFPPEYAEPTKWTGFVNEAERVITDIPGNSGAALATGIPFTGGLPVLAIRVARPDLGEPIQGQAFLVGVGGSYFRTLGLSAMGHEISGARADSFQYNVDRGFAARYLQGLNPIGRTFRFAGTHPKPDQTPTVAGVVPDIPYNGIADASGIPFIYYPITTRPSPSLTFFVRTTLPLESVVRFVRDGLAHYDNSIGVYDCDSLDGFKARSLQSTKALLTAIVATAVLCAILAGLGIYGMLAFEVSQRRREMGIRCALGATSTTIASLVLRQSLLWGGAGTAGGLLLGIAGARLISGMLYGVSPIDPVGLAGAVFFVIVAITAASWVPARQAARLNPAELLRTE